MKIWHIRLLVIVCVFGLAGAALAGSLDFTIENQTGIDIYELYIAPYQSGDWGKETLDGAILADGGSLGITFDNRKETYWDIMIRDENGKEVIWRKFNLKKISKITLSYDGKTASAEYE